MGCNGNVRSKTAEQYCLITATIGMRGLKYAVEARGKPAVTETRNRALLQVLGSGRPLGTPTATAATVPASATLEGICVEKPYYSVRWNPHIRELTFEGGAILLTVRRNRKLVILTLETPLFVGDDGSRTDMVVMVTLAVRDTSQQTNLIEAFRPPYETVPVGGWHIDLDLIYGKLKLLHRAERVFELFDAKSDLTWIPQMQGLSPDRPFVDVLRQCVTKEWIDPNTQTTSGTSSSNVSRGFMDIAARVSTQFDGERRRQGLRPIEGTSHSSSACTGTASEGTQRLRGAGRQDAPIPRLSNSCAVDNGHFKQDSFKLP